MTQGAATTHGFLLRAVDYGESDRILTLFTEHHGKISAYARGARKSQKRFGGALEPFALTELRLAPGRNKRMWRLEEARPVRVFEGMAQDLRRLEVGSRFIMILRESLPAEAPDQSLFTFMETIIDAISRAKRDDLPCLSIAAEARLYHRLGTALCIDRCIGCGRKVPPGKPVLLHPARGGVVCTPCGGGPLRLESPTLDALRTLLDAPLEEIPSFSIKASDLRIISGMLKAFAEHHLG